MIHNERLLYTLLYNKQQSYRLYKNQTVTSHTEYVLKRVVSSNIAISCIPKPSDKRFIAAMPL
jgi:hypothetical protein